MEADENWMEDEFLEDFLNEAKEHLEDIENSILKMEKDINDRVIVNVLFRSFHSLKGLAGFVNMGLIQILAHSTESLLDCIRKKVILPKGKCIELILKSADYIKEIVAKVEICNDPAFKNKCDKHVATLKGYISETIKKKETNPITMIETPKKKEIEIKTEGLKIESELKKIADAIEESKMFTTEMPIEKVYSLEEKKIDVLIPDFPQTPFYGAELPWGDEDKEKITVDMIINGRTQETYKETSTTNPETREIKKAEEKPKEEIHQPKAVSSRTLESIGEQGDFPKGGMKMMQNKEDVKSGKYLTFSIGVEDYGIPIQTVREIIGMLHITNIPKTPEYIKGVVNLRGKIIPIMDLRLKFGLEKKEYSERTCIIVVEIKTETGHDQMSLPSGRRSIGVVVDMVSEVLNINASEIELSPQDDVQNEGEFITGMGKVKDKVVMLLDVEKVLNREEFKYLKEMKGGV